MAYLVVLPLMYAITQPRMQYDVVIYGATPSGISAALSFARLHQTKSVAIVESSRSIGGMSSPGGIGLRDFSQVYPCCTMYEWGMANAKAYNVSSPVWQPDGYIGEKNFLALIHGDSNIDVHVNQTVVQGSVKKDSATLRVTEFSTNTATWTADFFVDASYEGLLVREVATTTYGRESINQYNESLAGVREPGSPKFDVNVSSLDADGNLIKYVDGGKQPAFGSADKGVMGFSFRPCVTNNQSNRVPFPIPANYSAADFELMRRYLNAKASAGDTQKFNQIFGVLPYRSYPPADKWDLCDSGGTPVTSDVVDGTIAPYMNGTHTDRAEVYDGVKYYVQGYLYTVQNDPSVPEETRQSAAEWGLCKDEFQENGHFPTQLYVREALRLVGDSVFTQNKRDAINTTHSIGLGSWGYDIHVVHRRSREDNFVYDEGFYGPEQDRTVFQLPLSLIQPKRSDVTNLLATVVVSCTHVTWACIREEPTLWLLGMAAGTTLALINSSQSVQDVPVQQLQASLQAQGVHLS
ncbi:hypothetical protein DIPPA_00257 [Diplonema papillatum]|nr:hypothetical protein DIPPA_00257 [Diplonema papillatum]